VVHIVEHYYRDKEFAVITPYDAQRGLAERALRAGGLPWEDRVFNLDSFQGTLHPFAARTLLTGICHSGNERDYIIISLVRTSQTGFLTNVNRLNVLLTRCKKGMVVVANRDFLHTIGCNILVAKFAAHWKYLHGETATWVNSQKVAEGSADLPGAPGPNRERGLQATGYALSFNYGPDGTVTYARSADARTSIPTRYRGQHDGFDTSKLWKAKPPVSTPPSWPKPSNSELFPELFDSLLERRQIPPKAKGTLWSVMSGHQEEQPPTLPESRLPSPHKWRASVPSLSSPLPHKTRPSDNRAQRFSLLNREPPSPTGTKRTTHRSSGGVANPSSRPTNGASWVAPRSSRGVHFTTPPPPQIPVSHTASYGQRRTVTTTSHNRITFVNNQGYSRTSHSSSIKGVTGLNPAASPFQYKPGKPSPANGYKDPLREPPRVPEPFLEADGWTRVDRRKGFGRKSFAEVAQHAETLPSRANGRTKGNRYWIGRWVSPLMPEHGALELMDTHTEIELLPSSILPQPRS
jgi:AAA domain